MRTHLMCSLALAVVFAAGCQTETTDNMTSTAAPARAAQSAGIPVSGQVGSGVGSGVGSTVVGSGVGVGVGLGAGGSSAEEHAPSASRPAATTTCHRRTFIHLAWET